MELWQLKRNEEDVGAAEGGDSGGNASSSNKGRNNSSVLDRAQDRNFLALGNVKVNHSDGLRAEAPIEE